jgi:hypothetical protein
MKEMKTGNEKMKIIENQNGEKQWQSAKVMAKWWRRKSKAKMALNGGVKWRNAAKWRNMWRNGANGRQHHQRKRHQWHQA